MATPRSVMAVHASLSGAFEKTIRQISSSGTSPPPPPCTSMLKIRKTMVRRAPVLREACACAQRAVPKACMSPKTCPHLTLSTIVATGQIYSVVMELHQHNTYTLFAKNGSEYIYEYRIHQWLIMIIYCTPPPLV